MNRKRVQWIAFFSACLLAGGSLMGPPLAWSFSQSFGGIRLTQIQPRILTPNGDSLNDVIYFKFDNSLAGLPVESSIFDINGAKVSGMKLGTTDDSALTWDGKDQSGRLLPAGIYVFSIKIGKKLATGTVVVAR